MIESLSDNWIRSGIEAGDILLLHSDIKRTLMEARRKGFAITPADILDSFINAVGPKGTLLLPLFNFNFTKGEPFDIKSTPSQMGALTELARHHKSAVRTGHPIYSFVAIGYNSKEFSGVDNLSGYSEESPFGIIKRLGGKIASLDLDDQSSMTFYHHVEEVKAVNYRYFKNFSGKYMGVDGVEKIKEYKLFVRDLESGVLTDVNSAGELMWEMGLYKGYRPKVDTGLRVVKAQEMFSFVEQLIDSGKALGNLYSMGVRNDR